MQQQMPKAEVIMAGIGGLGVLSAGQLLAWSALGKHKHISWVPSYDTNRRGGLCECTVVISDDEITSPILDQAQTVVLFDGSQIKVLERRVRPGGVMIVESAGLTDTAERKDFKLLPVSALEVAAGMGDSVLISLVLLGVYVGVTRTISAELIDKELDKRYASKASALNRNKEAFRKGLELARSIKG